MMLSTSSRFRCTRCDDGSMTSMQFCTAECRDREGLDCQQKKKKKSKEHSSSQTPVHHDDDDDSMIVY